MFITIPDLTSSACSRQGEGTSPLALDNNHPLPRYTLASQGDFHAWGRRRSTLPDLHLASKHFLVSNDPDIQWKAWPTNLRSNCLLARDSNKQHAWARCVTCEGPPKLRRDQLDAFSAARLLFLYLQCSRWALGDGLTNLCLRRCTRVNYKLSVFHLEYRRGTFHTFSGVNTGISVICYFHRKFPPSYFLGPT